MRLEGALSSRGNQPEGDYCPIERTLRVLGTRSTLLVLREAFYGATRFDEFTARAALTDATVAARLRDLSRSGILEKRPYREPGQRQRSEYVLTKAGEDLMPAVFALLVWGNRYDPPPYPPQLHHTDCGAPVTIDARCDAGHTVSSGEISVSTDGPFGLDDPIDVEAWDSRDPSTESPTTPPTPPSPRTTRR